MKKVYITVVKINGEKLAVPEKAAPLFEVEDSLPIADVAMVFSADSAHRVGEGLRPPHRLAGWLEAGAESAAVAMGVRPYAVSISVNGEQPVHFTVEP